EQPSVEETTEQPQDEESTEEPENNYSNTEEEYPEDSIPSQHEQPRYEERVEDFYQSYEEAAGEDYEEPSALQTAEETVEEYTEGVTEEAPEEQTAEPEEEAYAEPETTEEAAEVTSNHKEAEVFSITGEVVEGDTGMENVTGTLPGDGEKEAATDESGTFSVKEMPPGDYELQMEVPDGYTAKKKPV